MSLDLDNRLGSSADELYAILMRAHEGLSDAQSRALDARLVLLLMNQVGDAAAIEQAIALAAQSVQSDGE